MKLHTLFPIIERNENIDTKERLYGVVRDIIHRRHEFGMADDVSHLYTRMKDVCVHMNLSASDICDLMTVLNHALSLISDYELPVTDDDADDTTADRDTHQSQTNRTCTSDVDDVVGTNIERLAEYTRLQSEKTRWLLGSVYLVCIANFIILCYNSGQATLCVNH